MGFFRLLFQWILSLKGYTKNNSSFYYILPSVPCKCKGRKKFQRNRKKRPPLLCFLPWACPPGPGRAKGRASSNACCRFGGVALRVLPGGLAGRGHTPLFLAAVSCAGGRMFHGRALPAACPRLCPCFPPGVVRFLQGLAVAGARCRAGKHAANKKPRRRARLCQLRRCRHGAAAQTFERHIQFPTGKAQTPSPGQKAPRPTPRPAGPLPGLLPGRCRPPLPGAAVQPDAPAPPRSAGSRPNMARSLVHSRPFCSATA